MPRKDANQIAFALLQKVTGEAPAAPLKDEVAAAAGRLGGIKGGAVRNKTLTPARRSEIARVAATQRWKKKET